MGKLFCRLLIGIALVNAGVSMAQTYPSRPVKVIVPFAAGSASDTITRSVADKLTISMGQPFIVENRAGAGSTIANDYVAKSPPDGYTLLISTAALPVGATAYTNLRYDTSAFTSVTVFTHSPLALAVNPNFPAKNVSEFIEYAKMNPDKVNFGSLGIGTSHHVTAEKLKLDAAISMVHVPYKGSGPAHLDLMGGQIQVMFDNLVALMPHFKSGKLRPLAVSTLKRNPQLPDVPTLSESGVKGFEAVAWFGMVAPPGTPKDIVYKLNTEIVKALNTPELRQRLTDGGSEVIANSPEEADRFLKSEIAKWGKVVKAAKITAE
ncbi:tripartite tricarboxylate transporter substrate binding protein [Polynucleobacter sp. AP-Latsch-80-C2]|jgi:tripartite-type tricarboxylate transporter receptor subunit TctC|uniref:tripartite tricarboxylate transporter substrate binding protein n=1 Tax=Polynucleobacter sp. AP-Latsch-80-C2 TaxID=2576931 RepID=UPI001C0C7D09|nr:tripartite tricarboxylate transporter substrate binding protein [Polynucleobacter sp. AP-Latsch-80-C2]MBU3624320.1 tripartite tricarboxylate transporter substrate binding protein [Polynucleobacter sp. AP-Latsch-80-C2]